MKIRTPNGTPSQPNIYNMYHYILMGGLDGGGGLGVCFKSNRERIKKKIAAKDREEGPERKSEELS